MMMWGLMIVLGISIATFVGGMIYSFRATGRIKRNLTLAAMMF